MKKLKFKMTTKIGLFITLYFISILALQTLTYRNSYIDFLSPYPQPSGHITGDIAAFGIGLVYFLLGIAGIIVFYFSKRNTPHVIQIFLFLTSLSGLLSVANIHSSEGKQTEFYALDILLGIVGIFGIIMLQIWSDNEEK